MSQNSINKTNKTEGKAVDAATNTVARGDLDPKDYHLFWYDRYTNGYMSGASHAVDETFKSLCGLDFTGDIGKTPIDGGYQNCEEAPPNCKKCMKKLGLTIKDH